VSGGARIAAAVVTALVLGASGTAAAEDYRIGVIHIERILRESPPARAALVRIEQEFKARDTELAGREGALRAEVAQLEKDKPKLDADAGAARERDLEARGRELARQRQQFAEDVRTRQFEALDRLKERLDQVLTKMAHDRGYDLILQNALWVGKSVDITDEVIKALAP